MGSQVLAICNCGVSNEILIGGGMRTFKHTQYFPFACETCSDVIQANLLGNPPRCSKCGSENIISYDDDAIIVEQGEKTVAQTFNHIIRDGLYRCPGCGGSSLKFMSTGFHWD